MHLELKVSLSEIGLQIDNAGLAITDLDSGLQSFYTHDELDEIVGLVNEYHERMKNRKEVV